MSIFVATAGSSLCQVTVPNIAAGHSFTYLEYIKHAAKDSGRGPALAPSSASPNFQLGNINGNPGFGYQVVIPRATTSSTYFTTDDQTGPIQIGKWICRVLTYDETNGVREYWGTMTERMRESAYNGSRTVGSGNTTAATSPILNWGDLNQFNNQARTGSHGAFAYCHGAVLSLAEMDRWRRNPWYVPTSCVVLCIPSGIEAKPFDYSPSKRSITYYTAPTLTGAVRIGDPLPVLRGPVLEEEDDLLAGWVEAAGGTGVTLTPSVPVSTWITPSPTLTPAGVTLTPSPAVSSWVAPSPTLTVGPVTLSPSVPLRSWITPAPSLSVGGVSLSPSVALSSWISPTPGIAGALTLTPSVSLSTWIVPTPTLLTGVTLTPSAPISTWTSLSASLSVGPVTLSPAAPIASWIAPAPAISGALTLSPLVALRSWIAPSPSLGVGALTLPATVAMRTWVVPVPSLSSGLTLTPSVAVSSWIAASPTLSAGPLTLNASVPVRTWIAITPSIAVGAVALSALVAIARWIAVTPTFGPAIVFPILDEPLSIDFDSLASAIDFTALTTTIDFDSLETVLVFLDGGTDVLELTIIKGEITPIAMTLLGADPDDGALVPYDVTAASSVKLNAGMPGKTLIINAKDLTKTDAANGRVTYNPDPLETAAGGRYDALVVATFPGSPGVVRKFPGRLVIRDAIA